MYIDERDVVEINYVFKLFVELWVVCVEVFKSGDICLVGLFVKIE